MNKYYGLTNQPSSGKVDKAPDWMDSFFQDVTTEKPKEVKKQHFFEGVDDPILNPNRIGLDK